MARQGRVKLTFDCRTCKERVKLSLYFGVKNIWNNTTSPTLQKLKPHQNHKLSVSYEFEPG